MQRAFIAFSFCAAALLATASATAAPCVREKDCPGDQACRDGECVDAPPAARACVREKDCPGDQACRAGACVDVDSSACAKDKDCPGDDVCNAGRCAAPAIEPRASPPVAHPRVDATPKKAAEPSPRVAFVDLRLSSLQLVGDDSRGFLWSPGVHWGARNATVGVRYLNLAGYSGVGLAGNFFRFGHGWTVAEPGGWKVSILPPSFEVMFGVIDAPLGDDPVVLHRLAVDAVGARVAKSFGGMVAHASVSGPSLSAGVINVSGRRFRPDDVSVFVGIGMTLDVGITF